MAQLNIKMQVTCKTADVLATLRTNRAQHSEIVAEAREGYVKRARIELEQKLEKIKAGKIVSLYIALKPPEDNTSAYDTAIRMLEMHQDDTISLSASEVRMLVQDEWDWADQFLLNNAGYSVTSAAMARGKGLDV